MKTYTAHAWRDTDNIWTIEIPELSSTNSAGEAIPATGLAPSWRSVENAAKEIIAAWTNTELADVAVEIVVIVPHEAQALWDQSSQLEQQGRKSLAQASTMRREAISSVRQLGYPTEAIGKVFGVSQQRVAQLAKSGD